MNEQVEVPANQIPNLEINAVPESFRAGPTAAIRAAVDSSNTVNSVLSVATYSLAARADKFTQDVGVKAVEIADKRGGHAVDVPDIANAEELIYPRERDAAPAWQWAVLGIIAGGLISFLITILAPSLPDSWKIATVIVSVLGIIACIIWVGALMFPDVLRKNKR